MPNLEMDGLLVILTLIVFTSCGQATKSDNSKQTDKLIEKSTKVDSASNDKNEEKSENFECTDFDFNSVEEQADSLLYFMERATDSNSVDRHKWEQKFFCAFPNSFNEMENNFGFDNKNGAAPLYYQGNNVIEYFSRLKSIPDSLYFNKYVKININGIWEADNIGYAFDFDNRLLIDTTSACESLTKFNDREIISVFRFMFDGPHPMRKDHQKHYEELKEKIGSYNSRLSLLLTEGYETLMSEDHSH